MPCLKGLHGFHGHSMHQPMMPVEFAVRMCLNRTPPIGQQLQGSPQSVCRQVPASILTPAGHSKGRALTQRSASADCSSAKKKRVAFADSKGLSLTAVCFFTDKEEPVMMLGEWVEPVEVACNTIRPQMPQETRRLRLDFLQPSADFSAFLRQLQESLVALESCSVTDRALSGTVRVKNVSYEKDVRLRVTFDSWRSHHDVPCTYLHQSYGASDTDAFAFDIPVPDLLDTQDRFEFCVSYQPGGYSAPLWDNNKGQNYCVHIETKAVKPIAKLCGELLSFGGLQDSQPSGGRTDSDYSSLHRSTSCPDTILGRSWGVPDNTAAFWL